MNCKTIPVIRIFDEAKAKDFYLDYLGMNLDWEERSEDDHTLYLQVSKGDLVFHLSEYSADCAPGSKTFVNLADLDSFYSEINS